LAKAYPEAIRYADEALAHADRLHPDGIADLHVLRAKCDALVALHTPGTPFRAYVDALRVARAGGSSDDEEAVWMDRLEALWQAIPASQHVEARRMSWRAWGRDPAK
jgi:hypothetical protein